MWQYLQFGMQSVPTMCMRWCTIRSRKASYVAPTVPVQYTVPAEDDSYLTALSTQRTFPDEHELGHISQAPLSKLPRCYVPVRRVRDVPALHAFQSQVRLGRRCRLGACVSLELAADLCLEPSEKCNSPRRRPAPRVPHQHQACGAINRYRRPVGGAEQVDIRHFVALIKLSRDSLQIRLNSVNIGLTEPLHQTYQSRPLPLLRRGCLGHQLRRPSLLRQQRVHVRAASRIRPHCSSLMQTDTAPERQRPNAILLQYIRGFK